MSKVHLLLHRYPKSGFQIQIRDWEISDQGMTVIWGPSGAGKSSLLRLLMGLDRADQLSWLFDGIEMNSLSIQQRKVGAVFQDSSLFWGLTVSQNLDFAKRAAIRGRGVDVGEVSSRLQVCIERLGLDALLSRPAELLSGGERSRVALARALIGKPRLLMLDEPFSSLDLALKLEARALVREIIEEFRIPALLVTHDEGDFDSSRDTIVRISSGKKLD